MKKLHILAALLLGAMMVTSCDDGPIIEDNTPVSSDGYVAKLTGNITGVSDWSSQYTVVLAGFDGESEYAITQKSLPSSDGQLALTLSSIDESVKTIELCITNKLRKRIMTLKSMDITAAQGDTIRMDVGSLNVGQFNTIQQQIFNTTCANCHGASTSAAAGLFLTEGKSYENLVNAPSKKESDKNRVTPGDASNSVLYRVLTTEVSKDWHYDHTSEVIDTDIQALIKNWINAGAAE